MGVVQGDGGASVLTCARGGAGDEERALLLERAEIRAVFIDRRDDFLERPEVAENGECVHGGEYSDSNPVVLSDERDEKIERIEKYGAGGACANGQGDDGESVCANYSVRHKRLLGVGSPCRRHVVTRALEFIGSALRSPRTEANVVLFASTVR